MNYLKTVNGANLQITYSTRITQQVNGTEIYINSAELYFGGNRVDAAAADTSFTMPPILNKVGKYDDSTAPYATYTVTVNPLELNVDAAVIFRVEQRQAHQSESKFLFTHEIPSFEDNEIII